MDNQYDFIIGVERLFPPIGLYHYSAKIISLTKASVDQERVEFIEPKLGEYLGTTQTEAIEQAEQEIKKWLASKTP